MSSAFERFKNSYSKGFSRDGPPLDLLDQMDEEERKKIETLLLSKLKPDDISSIEALGYLRSQQAFTQLVEMLPKATNLGKVYIAEALWRIRRYEPALTLVCQTLMSGSLASNDARRMAAIVLREIPEKPAIKALSFALEDDEYLVRYHAQLSLAVLLGLQEELKALEPEMYGLLRERQKAAEKFKQLVANTLHNYQSRKGG